MLDVQSSCPDHLLRIDKVGIKNLTMPLVVRDKANGQQQTVASLDLNVDLPPQNKGTHMSRFLEALGDKPFQLDYWSCKDFLVQLRQRLQAKSARFTFSFPYFLRHEAPASGLPSLTSYDCQLSGQLTDNSFELFLAVTVPVMTVCPCSLAISETGAHSQRAQVKIKAAFSGLLWLEDLIAIGRQAGSSPVYTLLKRNDEKHVTEQAFASPTFVEDVVRGAAQALTRHELVTAFQVEVESFESIHNHNAYACIECQKATRCDKEQI